MQAEFVLETSLKLRLRIHCQLKQLHYQFIKQCWHVNKILYAPTVWAMGQVCLACEISPENNNLSSSIHNLKYFLDHYATCESNLRMQALLLELVTVTSSFNWWMGAFRWYMFIVKYVDHDITYSCKNFQEWTKL